MYWQLADAKNRFSELMTKALSKGPQRIRRRNQAVVVLDEKEYNRLTGKKKSFTEHLMSMPDISDLDLTRDQSLMRDVEF